MSKKQDNKNNTLDDDDKDNNFSIDNEDTINDNNISNIITNKLGTDPDYNKMISQYQGLNDDIVKFIKIINLFYISLFRNKRFKIEKDTNEDKMNSLKLIRLVYLPTIFIKNISVDEKTNKEVEESIAQKIKLSEYDMEEEEAKLSAAASQL